MDNVTKMFLVPQNIFNRSNSSTNFTELDRLMQEILYSDLNTDADKWKLYTNVLDRYLNRVREQDKPLVVPFIEKTEKNNSDIPFKEGLREDHIEMFTQKLSKSLKNKASLI